MNNRLTVSTLACPNWSFPRIVEQLAAAGVQGVDLRGVLNIVDHTLLPAFAREADSTRALLAGRGLTVPCMCSSVRLMIADEHEWQNALDEYRRYIAAARAFGSPFVRIFPGMTPQGMDRPRAIDLAHGHAAQLAEIASGTGVVPLLETHDDWGAASEVVKLLAGCSPDAFGIIWDIRHTWAAGEAPAHAIATLGPRLRHVHVKDSVIVDGKEQPALLGAGVVPAADSLHALVEVGYAGWVCLETEKRWHPSTAPEPEVSVRQFVEFVTGI